MVQKNELVVKYISLEEMVVDLLIKATTSEIFKGHVVLMGVRK